MVQVLVQYKNVELTAFYKYKGPAKRIQHHPTLLDNVAHCWARWPNECNMLDSTLWLERPGSKIYPESLENKCVPYWFA